MTRAFFGNWFGAFKDGWAVARAVPILVVAMIGIELVQHAVEWHLGFFSIDKAVRRAASEEPLRWLVGWPKMLTTYAIAFFATRWLVLRNARVALHPSKLALGRYAWVVLFLVLPVAAMIHARAILPVFGLGEPEVITFRMIFGLFSLLTEPLLLLWFVNAAVGTKAYGPAASAGATRWLYLWSFLLLFVTRVPLSQLHARLNEWPAGQTFAVQWAMLSLDALVVGVLTLVLPAIQVRAARFIAERRGVGLLDDMSLRGDPSPRPARADRHHQIADPHRASIAPISSVG